MPTYESKRVRIGHLVLGAGNPIEFVTVSITSNSGVQRWAQSARNLHLNLSVRAAHKLN